MGVIERREVLQLLEQLEDLGDELHALNEKMQLQNEMLYQLLRTSSDIASPSVSRQLAEFNERIG